MDPVRPVRILHLIDSLPREGAEMLLFDLIQRSDRSLLDFSVCSLTGGGGVEKMLAELGVAVRPGTCRLSGVCAGLSAPAGSRSCIRIFFPAICGGRRRAADAGRR